jgi:cyclophilin family peptidyl-prolyl cis-trans isomerase/uncharacterized cupredoxin-like copper-binding protein
MRARLIWIAVLLLTLSQPGVMPALAQSERFQAGDIATIRDALVTVREAPGESSPPVVNIGQGSRVRILDSVSVEVDGASWWHVEHLNSGAQGWVLESSLGSLQAEVDADAGAQSATPEPALAVEPAIDAEACWTEDQELDPAGGIPQWSEQPAMVIDPEKSYFATIGTGEGDILIELLDDVAPVAVNNFVCLASVGFYDGTGFHRLFKGLFIQGGDPTGTGDGGPGYTFSEELPVGYAAGDVAMANNAPDANGSQFFIAAADLTDLIPHDYPVFGRVTSGLEVVEAISLGEVEPDIRGERSSALDPVTITTVTIQELDPRIGPPAPGPVVDSDDSDPSADAGEIVITANDIFFEPAEISIPAGTDATVTVVNQGAVEHNFSIDELEISRTIAPGGQQRIVINAPAGTYEFYCNMPGHREAGMAGQLIVGEGETATATAEPSVSRDGSDTEDAPELLVTANDIFFDPDELSIEAMQPQIVTVVNEGAANHNFSIDELGVDVDVAPGETGAAFILAPAGEYEFYCNVPGHREAGMVGTLLVTDGGTNQIEDVQTASGCDGLEEYQAAYDEAFFSGLFSDPDAIALLTKLEGLDAEGGFTEGGFSELSPDEWRMVGALFDAIAVEFAAITPPEFAASWHDSQIQIVKAMAEMYRTLGDGGTLLALIPDVAEIERLDSEGLAALESAAVVCPEFREWALEQGISLDE